MNRPGRSRTYNQRRKRPLLCQLSYGTIVTAGIEPATCGVFGKGVYAL